MAKLDVRAFGLTLGIVWSASLIIMAILAMTIGYGREFVSGLSKVYLGYKPTAAGAMIGAVWGFFDAGIGGVVIAWLYNIFAR